MNAIQNFLDMQDYQHQQVINNQMSDEELQQVLGGLTGVPRPPQEFEYGQAHAEDLKKIFIRSCYEMSKWYYKNQVQFVSSMWPAQFVRDASEATGQELSLAFIRDALGRQSNLLLEQFLNQGSKHPNIRLFKGKEMTKRIADHFYLYANNTFGWRETEKSTITLEGDWEGAALLMPRNNEDVRSTRAETTKSRIVQQSSRKCRRCSKQSRTAESTKPITAAAVTAVTTSIDDGAMESVRPSAATQLDSLEKSIKWQRSALDQGIEKMIEIAHRQDRQEREKVCKSNLFLCI